MRIYILLALRMSGYLTRVVTEAFVSRIRAVEIYITSEPLVVWKKEYVRVITDPMMFSIWFSICIPHGSPGKAFQLDRDGVDSCRDVKV